MAPITAPTFAHTLDASIKQHAGDNLSRYLDLQDSHVLQLFQGLAPNDKYPENVRLWSSENESKELTLPLRPKERPDFGEVYNRRLKNGWAEIATLHTRAVVALNVSRCPAPSTRADRV